MSALTSFRQASGLFWLLTALAGLVGLCAACSTPPASQKLTGRADIGQRLYNENCLECHAIDHHRIGPLHQGVVGRIAGTAPGYDYSTGLKRLGKTGLRWTPETLDRWLTDPDAYVQNQQMDFSVPDPQDRADLIAYLATLK
ncbi:MAG TPA: c-type cytochrome [Candidatus Aquabacterium excrementipullorum]|nr:c-type cytochrome [Candidatus Aquabacterium excrementipullorum]